MLSRMRAGWAGAGALGVAGTVAATIFCCLPFATGIVGAGVAAVGARFAPLQPYLDALSIGLLGYAWYQAFRPGTLTCVGDACDVPASRRYRRMTVVIMTVIVALLLTAPLWANWVIYWTL